jgi:hypothetical protein
MSFFGLGVIRQEKTRIPDKMASSPYNIRMPPDVWGPIFWNAIHIVTLAYPQNPTEADKIGARKFFESLQTVLPCPVCRQHYAQKLLDTPIEPALQSRGELIHWAWDIHNSVNVMLGKPTITVETFIENMHRLGESGTSQQVRQQWNLAAIATAATAGILLGAVGYHVWRRAIKA